ncbi:MAG: hypothetical protein BRD50_08280 [Bacteroidetes bacterium SW_11_45_7]|nr:MAG: hypothetical protein BRD50_08280 [Bacteroidetes bacterium SW_11_45_7]
MGIVLRTREYVKPVYVSPGHLCDFEGAQDLVCKRTSGSKLPEPARQAHILVNQLRKGNLAEGQTRL